VSVKVEKKPEVRDKKRGRVEKRGFWVTSSLEPKEPSGQTWKRAKKKKFKRTAELKNRSGSRSFRSFLERKQGIQQLSGPECYDCSRGGGVKKEPRGRDYCSGPREHGNCRY